jgi:hypothetical protein
MIFCNGKEAMTREALLKIFLFIIDFLLKGVMGTL